MTARNMTRKTRACGHCKAEFVIVRGKKESGPRAAKWCSHACYRAAGQVDRTARLIAALNAPPEARPSRYIVRREVEALRRIARYVERPLVFRFPCKHCGVVFVTRRNAGLFVQVCKACTKAMKRKSQRIAKALRRARKMQIPYESIDPLQVFERDGWRCLICGIATPQGKRGTLEPDAPELDHVIALASGGRHTWDNVQCACRRCNQLKGTKTVEQTRALLIGDDDEHNQIARSIGM